MKFVLKRRKSYSFHTHKNEILHRYFIFDWLRIVDFWWAIIFFIPLWKIIKLEINLWTNLIAIPNVSKDNIQSIRSILSQATEQLRNAIETNEPANVVPIIENRNNRLTELLPQIGDSFVSQMVSTVIRRGQETIETLTASPGNALNEANILIKNRMHDSFFAYVEHSITED